MKSKIWVVLAQSDWEAQTTVSLFFFFFPTAPFPHYSVFPPSTPEPFPSFFDHLHHKAPQRKLPTAQPGSLFFHQSQSCFVFVFLFSFFLWCNSEVSPLNLPIHISIWFIFLIFCFSADFFCRFLFLFFVAFVEKANKEESCAEMKEGAQPSRSSPLPHPSPPSHPSPIIGLSLLFKGQICRASFFFSSFLFLFTLAKSINSGSEKQGTEVFHENKANTCWPRPAVWLSCGNQSRKGKQTKRKTNK